MKIIFFIIFLINNVFAQEAVTRKSQIEEKVTPAFKTNYSMSLTPSLFYSQLGLDIAEQNSDGTSSLAGGAAIVFYVDDLAGGLDFTYAKFGLSKTDLWIEDTTAHKVNISLFLRKKIFRDFSLVGGYGVVDNLKIKDTIITFDYLDPTTGLPATLRAQDDLKLRGQSFYIQAFYQFAQKFSLSFRTTFSRYNKANYYQDYDLPSEWSSYEPRIPGKIKSQEFMFLFSYDFAANI